VSQISTVLAGRYQLASRIAVGGAGEVWRGLDVTLDRPVAVKLLRPEYAQHPETLARFRSEARHAASLAHPGIARVFDYHDGGPAHLPFIVMELVDGPSLADVLLRERLSPDRVMGIIAQAAAALDAAHRAGLVHRDIKPANLLLTQDGVVKITDFGIAHAAGSAPVTRQGQLIGTPAYLAPERVAGQPATAASDLYSLGILAHECLTGSRPFAGTTTEIALAHGQQALPPLPGYVTPAIAAFVADLTAKDPADRPASARLASARAARLADGGPADTPSDWELGPAHPATLADVHAPRAGDLTAGLPLPASRADDRGWPRRRVALAVGTASVAAGLIGWAISGAANHGPAAPSRPSSPPAAAATQSALTVAVQAGTFVGQPVDAVVQQLRDLGLRPTISWVQDGGQLPGYDQTSAYDQSPGRGIVVSVQPTGPVPVGSVVTITAVPRHHGGDGQDQGGGSQGGGNGPGGN
jgi:eukaryotic-like serine/threonine-protein kinase